MKRFHRIISLLLSFAFLFSIIGIAPMTADAASTTLKVAYFSLDDSTTAQVTGTIKDWFTSNTVTADGTTISSVTFTSLTASQIQSGSLSSYDVLLIGAGGGGAITSALGTKGGTAIETFVANGGGYVGIHGGAYAAVLGYSTTTKYLELINYKADYPVSNHGEGQLVVRPSDTSSIITEDMVGAYYIAYAQNPAVLSAGSSTDSRMGTPKNVIKFVSNARNNLTASQNSNSSNYVNMTGTPAVACATFGSGHVAITGLQVHSANQPADMDFLFGRMLLYAAGYSTAKATPNSGAKLGTEIVGEWVNTQELYYEGKTGTTNYINQAAASGITDMYILVKGTAGSVAYTGSSYALATASYGSRDILDEVITQAHAKGIRVHAWVSALADSAYAAKYPNESLYHYKNGNSDEMISPRSTSYLTYMQNLVKEMLTKYDFDGLHLDYIRYNHIVGGWRSSDITQMKEYGIDVDELKEYVNGTYYATSVDDGYIFRAHGNNNNSVVQFAKMRCDNIKKFATSLVSTAKAKKSDIIVSGAYFHHGAYQGNHYVSGANSIPTTSSSFGELMYGQSYVYSADIFDYICPMIYSSSGGTNYDGSAQWVAALASSAVDKGNKVVPAIQAYAPASADSLNAEVVELQKLHAQKNDMLGFGFFRAGTYGYANSTYSSTENLLKVNVINGFYSLTFGKVEIEFQGDLKATSVYKKTGLSGATVSLNSTGKKVTITKTNLLPSDTDITIYLNTTGSLNKTLGPVLVRVYDTEGTMTRCYNTYTEGSAMPNAMTPVPTSSSALGTYTVDQIAEGMDRVVTYYNSNGSLPSYNTLNGVQVKIPAFLKLAATAIINIAAGAPSQPVSYTSCIAASSTSSTNFSSSTISKDGYLYLADKFVTYMNNNNGQAPNYTSFPGTSDLNYSGNIGYTRAAIIFARVMDFYHSYKQLPGFVCAASTATSSTNPTPPPATATPTATVAPTATPTAEVTVAPTPVPTPKASYTVSEVVEMMYDTYIYYLDNTAMPDSITYKGVPFTIPTYMKMAALALRNINNGNTTASIPYVECIYAPEYTNTFSSSTISKAGYLYAAERLLVYYDANDNQAPNLISYPGSSNTSYTGSMNFAKAACIISRALAAYKLNGSLPDTVSASNEAVGIMPSSLTVDQIIEGLSKANTYYSEKGYLPATTTIASGTASIPTYYRLGALAILAINGGNTEAPIAYVEANGTNGYSNTFSSTTISKAGYIYALSKTTTYMASNGNTPPNYVTYPGTSGTSYSGYLPYQRFTLMTVRICAYYKQYGVLPDYISISTDKVVETPTPAATVPPTAAPTTAAPTTAAPTTAAPTPTVAPTTAAPTIDASIPTPHPTLSTVASGTTFTVTQIADAAKTIVSHFDTYSALETEYSVAKAVKVGNYMITDEDWAYLAGYALAGLSGSYSASGLSGYTASTAVTYKKMGEAGVDAISAYTGTSLTIAEVSEGSWKCFSNYGNNNSMVAASCSSIQTVGAQLSYYSLLIASARALSHYSTYGTLPASVAFDKLKYLVEDTNSNEATVVPATQAPATVAPTTAAPTATVAPTTAAPTATPSNAGTTYASSAILYAGYSIDKYITNNPGVLPPYSNLGGTNVYMPELIGVFAQFIVDTNSGLTTDVASNGVTENEEIYEQLTAGTLTKAQYVKLAQDVLSFVAENKKAPGFLTSDLGALSMNTIISVFADAITELRSSGSLPASVTVEAWGSPLPIPPEEHATEFTKAGVLYAANTIYNYVTANNAYPRYATIDGEQVYPAELIGVFAQLIVNENASLDILIARNDATYAEKSYENIKGIALTKAQYVKAAQDVIDYINSSPSAAAPGFISTAIGTLSNETLLKVFATALAKLKSAGSMPASVTVSAWTTALPTPPEATETPEYQYLNFLGILKGARRVVDAIEAAGNIPNYVTLDAGTRVLPGTMARLFAATVSNINRGKATDMPLQEIATPKNIVSETMTDGTFTKAQYTKVASRMASTIYENDAVPTYITTDLGTMNYCNVIYMFARVLEYYLTYGFLPDTIDVQVWGTYEF